MVPVCLGGPDAVVVAGGARFGAHAALLAAHSGYFRALLAARPHDAAVHLHVPNVQPQHFWPLLAYMYTGHLDLSSENVYQVSLATHLLHMPRALDLCRSFLEAAQRVPRATVVRPIPIAPRVPVCASSSHLPRPIVADVPLRDPPVSEPEPEPEPEPRRDETRVPPRDGGAVIVDVACCDGPVRFHRVLNGAYGRGLSNEDDPSDDSDDSYVEVEVEAEAEADEGASTFEDSVRRRSSDASSGAAYSCAYCKHSFKSQYCYQKHARRHLNPVSMDAVGIGSPGSEAPASRASPSSRRPRHARDMNVQYYPCKTCGCKFPSYYFVHKHRKMCHADENDH